MRVHKGQLAPSPLAGSIISSSEVFCIRRTSYLWDLTDSRSLFLLGFKDESTVPFLVSRRAGVFGEGAL